MNKVVINMETVNTILGFVLAVIIMFNIGAVSYKYETKKIVKERMEYVTEQTVECAAYVLNSFSKK